MSINNNGLHQKMGVPAEKNHYVPIYNNALHLKIWGFKVKNKSTTFFSNLVPVLSGLSPAIFLSGLAGGRS
jgi:hypothetical protein